MTRWRAWSSPSPPTAINDYPIVLLKDAPNPAEAAKAFIPLQLLRAEPKKVLTEAGFRFSSRDPEASRHDPDARDAPPAQAAAEGSTAALVPALIRPGLPDPAAGRAARAGPVGDVCRSS